MRVGAAPFGGFGEAGAAAEGVVERHSRAQQVRFGCRAPTMIFIFLTNCFEVFRFLLLMLGPSFSSARASAVVAAGGVGARRNYCCCTLYYQNASKEGHGSCRRILNEVNAIARVKLRRLGEGCIIIGTNASEVPYAVLVFCTRYGVLEEPPGLSTANDRVGLAENSR